MKKCILLLICIIASVAITGCSVRLGQFTVASTQNVQNLDYVIFDKTKQHVTGSTCVHSILIFPFGHFDDRIQRAMDDAITNGHNLGNLGDFLVNVRIDQRAWSAIFYGQDCILVEGDLVNITKK